MAANNEWFLNEIGMGLSKLASLRLEGTPSSENMRLTTLTWLETIESVRQWKPEHIPVIKQTFTTLLRTAKRWVSPAQFIELLPSTHQCHRELPALPKPSIENNQKYLQNLAKFKEDVAGVFEKLSMEHHLKEKERARSEQLAKEQEMKRKMDWATRMDLVKMKKIARAHSEMICEKTEEICPFWQQLNWAINDIEMELQEKENAIACVPEITPILNEPVKKSRRKKVAL